LQRVEGSTTVFDKFSALHIVEKFIVFWVEETPRKEEIQLAATQSSFDCRRIFDGWGVGYHGG
jgi:hypothetical protein